MSKTTFIAKAAVPIILLSVSLTSCKGFFVEPELASITITPTTPSIAIASTQQMVATGTYDDDSTRTITTAVTWSTSDESIASVTSGGIVTGVNTGTATITATYGAISTTTTVTVTVANLKSIAISPSSSSITSGQTQSFTALGKLKDGSNIDLTNSVTWNSSNTSAATIASTGIATGTSVSSTATTNITATSGSVTSNTSVLTVSP